MILLTAIEVGFDQTSYSIGEEDGSVSVCVVILSATVFENTVLSLDVTVMTTEDTATGEYMHISS